MNWQDFLSEYPRYKQHTPTPVDSHLPIRGGSTDDRDEDSRETWYVAPTSRTRDTGVREDSNFECFLAALGGEGEYVEVHRFGHWGPGWYEIILVSPRAPEEMLKCMVDMTNALANYPVVDDEDYSARREAECERVWNAASIKDRWHYLRRFAGKVPYVAARHEWDKLHELYKNLNLEDEVLSC